MRVTQSRIVDLLTTLGVDSAGAWSPATLASRVNSKGGVGRYMEPGDETKLSASQRQLFDAIARDQADGNLTEIAPDVPAGPAVAPEPQPYEASTVATATKPAPKKKGGKKAKPAAVKAPPKKKAAKAPKAAKGKPRPPAPSGNGTGPPPKGSPWSTFKAYWAVHPKQLTDRGPGVLRSVVRELKAAGKGANPRGVTKEVLVGILAAEFPDRKPDQMRTYVSNMVPTGLRDEYGIHVRKRKTEEKTTAYYVVGDGKEPPPAAE